MIVLNKKHIVYTSFIVIALLFAFTIQRANLYKTVETSSLPVTNKVIVIDARTRSSR